jgi:transaldolase
MKLFVDTARIDDIKHALDMGILDGVTTNPSKIKQAVEELKKKGEKVDLTQYIKKILRLCKGLPVSLEVIGSSYEEMIVEGKRLYKLFNPIARNVYVKIPINPEFDTKKHRKHDGLKVIRELSRLKIPVNCTLIFTPEQALLAAKAGAKFVSPFCGRLDDYLRTQAKKSFNKTDYFPAQGLTKGKKLIHDNGVLSGVDLVAQCVQLLSTYNLQTEVLAASIRNVRQLREVALVGSDIATMSLSTLESALDHPKTSEGMRGFTKDIVKEYAKIVRK